MPPSCSRLRDDPHVRPRRLPGAEQLTRLEVRDRPRDEDRIARPPLRRGRDLLLRRQLQRVDDAEDLVEVPARRHRIREHQLDRLVRPDHEDVPDGLVVRGRATVRVAARLGRQHAVANRDCEVVVADDRERGPMPLRRLDVVGPPLVVGDPVDGEADDLHAAAGKLLLGRREVAELGRADRREVLGVREERRPRVADPVVEADEAVGRLCDEVRRRAPDAERGIRPLLRDRHGSSYGFVDRHTLRGADNDPVTRRKRAVALITIATEFRILGPLEVVDDGRPIPLRGGMQRGLLALLLVHARQPVPEAVLLEQLWGARPPASGVTALRARVSQLRRALGPIGERITTTSGGYGLDAADEEIDARSFERRYGEGREALAAGDAMRARATLRAALALWRGAPLPDIGDTTSALAEIARLDELRLAAVEELMDADLALGRHAEVAAELDALVTAHPLRERLRGQLMLALYRSGRQAEALEIYRMGRAALVEELGIEPGKPLQALERAILRHDT